MLSKYDDEVPHNISKNEDIVNKYLKYKRKPLDDVISKWSQEMLNEFNKKWEELMNGTEEIAEEALDDESELSKSMKMNELGGKGGDILYKGVGTSSSFQ